MSFLDQVSRALGTDSQDGFIGNIGKQLTQNDAINNLYTVGGYLMGGPAGAAAANGLTGRAQGRDWSQVLSNAAGAYGGAYGIDYLLGSGGAGPTGGQFNFDPVSGTGSVSGGSELAATLAGNKGLGLALGGLLGGLAGQDTTTTASKDPWGPAQPYMKANLIQNALMQDHYAKDPFSADQKAAYQNQANTLANNQANVPNFNQIASNFMASKHGQMAAMPSLLSGTQAAPIDWDQYKNIGLLKG